MLVQSDALDNRNWACNASGIPGGADGGGYGSCCMANQSDPWFSWRDQGSGSPDDLQLFTARPATADPFIFAHTQSGPTRPPQVMPDYRMADYAENSYFGPRQGPAGVWNGVNTSSSGVGRWAYGRGAPTALYDHNTSSQWLAQPVGYELMLAGPSAALPHVSPVAVWRPIAPPGFTALGAVITASARRRPKRSAVRVLANECVAMCAARQLWCDAKAPAGRCSPVDGKSGGWSTAGYMAMASLLDEGATAVPMNLLWMATNRTDIVTEVPCVRSSCVVMEDFRKAFPIVAAKTDDHRSLIYRDHTTRHSTSPMGSVLTFESWADCWQPKEYRAQPYSIEGCNTTAGCRFDRSCFAATFHSMHGKGHTVPDTWDDQTQRRKYGYVLHENDLAHHVVPAYFDSMIQHLASLNKRAVGVEHDDPCKMAQMAPTAPMKTGDENFHGRMKKRSTMGRAL
eukprot:SAG31_NODE_1553_length_7905_cov_3.137330_1_plen_455_part_00